MKTLALTVSLALLAASTLPAADKPRESNYYNITTFDTPPGTALEVCSIELLPENKLALGTRRGEIWTVSGADSSDPGRLNYQLFASGQHEVLGLAYSAKDQSLYATNRYEVVRIKDEDGDGRADTFQTVNDQWGVSGDYHEYAWGSQFDKHGDLWVLLCLTGSFTSATDFRGWALRIKPDGTMVPTCSGIRSPGGIGFDAQGEVYFTDNQGPWRGACTLQHLVPGSFQGHPGGNAWYSKAPNMGPRPPDPNDNSRMEIERARIKELIPPAVYLTYGKIGNSSSFVACDLSHGKFGPFANQIFVGDQSHSNISRIYLEEVNGVKQGVVIPFLQGFKSGLIGGRMNEQGQLFVGGSDRGWGAKGGKPYDFERVEWTGKMPFEIQEVHAKADGFVFTFTQPLEAGSAGNPASYSAREFTYIYRSQYGSPEVDDVLPAITELKVAPDRKSVYVKLDRLTKGDIHEFHLDGLRSETGEPLLHSVAYYTLNEIPAP
jgi:glucose/arabinose dehydrogenase